MILLRIRNAQLVEKKEVNVPNSKIKLAIVKVLKEEGYIDNYRVNQLDNSKKSEIVITLKYYLGDPVIESVVRISKPGLRQYKSSLKLTNVTNEMGIAIVTTSKGVMTARNNPISVPKNVEITITGSEVTVKGPLGILKRPIESTVALELIDDHIKIKATDVTKFSNAMSGTVRALLANMVKGVSEGFEKKLTLVGVGYRAQAAAQKVNLSLGFSHPVDYEVPIGIKIETPSQTEIIIKGIDKQKVGQTAAEIRAYRQPEPYKGKGIRYSDEVIVLKETKKK